MAAKEERQLITNQRPESDAVWAPNSLRWLQRDEEESLRPNDLESVCHAEEDIARGEFVTVDEMTLR